MPRSWRVLGAAILLRAEVAAFRGRSVARWTILFLFYFPFSHVFSIFRPEALLLLASVGAWAAARHERWLIAWVAVAIAVVARPTGVLVAILVIAEIARRRPSLRAWAGISVPIIGLGAFSGYLGLRTGDPLAWVHVSAAWGRSLLDPIAWFRRYVQGGVVLSRYWDLVFFNVIAVVIGVLSAIRLAWRRRPGIALYQGAMTLTSPITGGILISEWRYIATAFPLFILAAEDPRLRRVRPTILAISTSLLVLVAAWLALDAKGVMA